MFAQQRFARGAAVETEAVDKVVRALTVAGQLGGGLGRGQGPSILRNGWVIRSATVERALVVESGNLWDSRAHAHPAIARIVAVWRCRYVMDGLSSNEIAALRSQ